jgi:photosystem II stability/assembly factor-like uncharacterized protein
MLAASADRGRTWQRYRLPSPDAGNWPYIDSATGTTLIAFQVHTSGNFTYLASTDAGATWRAVPIRSADAIPAGWKIFAGFGGGRVMAYDPATGDIVTAPLGTVDQFTLGGIPPSAGIWQERAGNPPSLAVSSDGGRTWDKRTLPPGIAGPFGSSVPVGPTTTVDGRRVLFMAEDGPTPRLYVSDDGARTWRAAGPMPQDGPILSLLATREGPIIIETSVGTYRSVDGGATFTRVGPEMGVGARAVNGGYVINTNNDAFGIWVSTDGGTWTYVHHPSIP